MIYIINTCKAIVVTLCKSWNVLQITENQATFAVARKLLLNNVDECLDLTKKSKYFLEVYVLNFNNL